jgi:DNA-directed RNA polymerase subunit RPC12/RpoP
MLRDTTWVKLPNVGSILLTEVEGEPLPKAKCNYCGDLILYKEGQQTTSMNRHNKLCQDYKDLLKGHIQDQGTLSFQPQVHHLLLLVLNVIMRKPTLSLLRW